ncbi:MAG: hypothetical protein O2819_03920 [Planctomycetota bacterium]|nr:hypothetical protein [Planctomycetota bacterium]MDA1106625.1 hypothetical protein [Planctomycetota bacterium]
MHGLLLLVSATLVGIPALGRPQDGNDPAGSGDAPPAVRSTAGPGQAELEASAALDAANMLAAVGLQLVKDTAASPAQLEAGAMMVRRALDLQGEDLGLWKIAALVVAVQDPADPQTARWRAEITQTLARLDPSSSVYRLARLVSWSEEAPTAEQRVARLQALTTDEQVASIGAPVAAHLAWDLYRLQQLRGDHAGADAAIARAVQVDPMFPAAAVVAAAMAVERHDDPVREAEWLVAAINANPSDFGTLRTLAALLLHEGAYASAARILSLMVGLESRASVSSEGIDGAVADQAIAFAGTGNLGKARESIARFQSSQLELYREYLVSQGISRSEAQSTAAPAVEILLVVDAFLAQAAGASDAAVVTESAIEALVRGTESRVSLETLPPELRRLAALESAYALAGLGAPSNRVESMIAPWKSELSPQATALLSAMVAHGEGRNEDTLRDLESASDEPAAALVRGMALSGLGQRAEAARAFRDALRVGNGTLLGVLAQLRLEAILGQPVPASPLVAALEERVAELPIEIDRLLVQGEPPVDLTISAPTAVFDAFTIPVFTLTITNRTGLVLSVSDDGPITPFVVLTWEAFPIGKTGRVSSDVPALFPIDAALQLGPRESVTVTIDARSATELLFTANRFAGRGMTLRLFTVVSPQVLPHQDARGARLAMPPGPLGVRRDSNLFQVGKFIVTPDWLEDGLAALRHPDHPGDVRLWAMLAAYTASLSPEMAESGSAPVSVGDRAEAAFLAEALASSWPNFPPLARAYLVLVSPAEQSPDLESVYAMARTDPDALVRACYLLRRTDDSQDPFLAECVRSDDPFLAKVAESQLQLLVRRAVQAGTTGTADR